MTQYLFVPVHSSNDDVDTVDYAVIEISPELQAVIKHRSQIVTMLKSTDQDVNMVEYWDNNVTYYTSDEVYTEEEEYEESAGPCDISGRPLEEVIKQKGFARIAHGIPTDPAASWRKLDCCMMEVKPKSVRWSALAGDIRVTTWDVSLSDIMG